MLEWLKDVAIIVGVPILRSVTGWAKNAFADGTVNKFEWLQLGETIVRVGVMSLAIYFGLNGMGIDADLLGSAASAFVADILFNSIKNAGNGVSKVKKK